MTKVAAAQQQRLEALMARWRILRDQGASLSAEEQAELEALIAAELEASAARATELADARRNVCEVAEDRRIGESRPHSR